MSNTKQKRAIFVLSRDLSLFRLCSMIPSALSLRRALSIYYLFSIFQFSIGKATRPADWRSNWFGFSRNYTRILAKPWPDSRDTMASFLKPSKIINALKGLPGDGTRNEQYEAKTSHFRAESRPQSISFVLNDPKCAKPAPSFVHILSIFNFSIFNWQSDSAG